MLEKLHILISLTAAFAVTFFCIITSTSFVKAIYGLIITIIVFYIAGIIVREYFIRNIAKEESEDIEEANNQNLELEEDFEDSEVLENDFEDDITAENIEEL